jgi:hypothetical protein
MYGESRDVHRVLMRIPDGKRPLGRPRHRWEENIRMNLQEMECGAWTESIWLRTGAGAGTCECSNKTLGSIKYGEFLN